VALTVTTEQRKFTALHGANNLAAIIARYPVRETPALDVIAKKLGFTGRDQYESAVRKWIMDEKSALANVQGFFGTLPTDIAAA